MIFDSTAGTETSSHSGPTPDKVFRSDRLDSYLTRPSFLPGAGPVVPDLSRPHVSPSLSSLEATATVVSFGQHPSGAPPEQLGSAPPIRGISRSGVLDLHALIGQSAPFNTDLAHRTSVHNHFTEMQMPP